MHAGATTAHTCEGGVIVVDDSPDVRPPNSVATAAAQALAPSAEPISPEHPLRSAAQPLPSIPNLQPGRASDGGSAEGDAEVGTPGLCTAAEDDSPDFFGALMGSYDGFAQRRARPALHSLDGSEESPASTGQLSHVIRSSHSMWVPHAWAEARAAMSLLVPHGQWLTASRVLSNMSSSLSIYLCLGHFYRAFTVQVAVTVCPDLKTSM